MSMTVTTDDTADALDPPVQPRSLAPAAVTVAVAAGVLGHAVLGFLARDQGTGGTVLYWLGLLAIYGPVAWRVLAPRTGSLERAGLLLLLGEALLLTRVVLYPTAFVHHDELAHQALLNTITDDHHLFGATSILPVIAAYPGMEIVTTAIHSTTGLPAHLSGVLVLIVARAILMVAMYRIAGMLTGNDRVAGLAVLIYAANPQFLFFNSQFSYQSVALPLALLTVYLAAQARDQRGYGRTGLAIAAGAAVVVTHHLTGLALVAVLAMWWLLARAPWCQRVPRLGVTTAGVAAVLAGWTLAFGRELLPYLSAAARRSWLSLSDMVQGDSSRALFADPAGNPTPLWERTVALATVIIFCLGLALAALTIRSWAPKRSAAAVVAVAVGMAYPFIPAGHLTVATAEVTDRSSGFVYAGLGVVLACWLLSRRPFIEPVAIPERAALTAVLCLVFAGGVILGSGPGWLRTPGPYLVSAENRSVDTDNLTSARWIGGHLPPGGRVLTDRVNGLLVDVYGRQHPINNLADDVDMAALSKLLLLGPRPDDATVAKANHVDFLVADRRLSSSLPHVGVYIENGEVGSPGRTTPPPAAALIKFDDAPGAERVYDNGTIRIYDLRGLS